VATFADLAGRGALAPIWRSAQMPDAKLVALLPGLDGAQTPGPPARPLINEVEEVEK